MFLIMALSILIFILSVFYLIYNYKIKNMEILKTSTNTKITPLLSNSRGGNFTRIYKDLKSNLIKNKEKRVRFNEKVKILNYEINKQNKEIEMRNNLLS
jgi:hypothetical protein